MTSFGLVACINVAPVLSTVKARRMTEPERVGVDFAAKGTMMKKMKMGKRRRRRRTTTTKKKNNKDLVADGALTMMISMRMKMAVIMPVRVAWGKGRRKK